MIDRLVEQRAGAPFGDQPGASAGAFTVARVYRREDVVSAKKVVQNERVRVDNPPPGAACPGVLWD